MKPSVRNRLREQLQTGDPLPAGEELSLSAAQRMRHRVLAETRPVVPRIFWRFATVAAAVAVVLVSARWLALGPGQQSPLVPWNERGDSANSQIAAIDPDEAAADRQIQFTTRGGTRVIWLLKPKMPNTNQPQELP